MAEMRPVIFLYTDAAEINARTKKAMTEAGFLPVKVATLDAVKFLEPAVRIEGELPPIMRAVLESIAANPQATVSRDYGVKLAKILLALSPAKGTPA